MFRCDRLDCSLPRTQCENRYRLAQGRTKRGEQDRRVTKYGPCRGCPIGAAHIAGEPTHQPIRLKLYPTTQEANVSAAESTRDYAERQCRRGNHSFKPTNATERACADPECKSKHAAPSSPAPAAAPRKRLTKAQRRAARRAAAAASSTTRPAIAPAPKLTSPAELLELAGFKVRVLRTPNGVLLQVSA